jgi:hypothetical protein
MEWTPYNKKLDLLFNNSGFDMLEKLGFPIWSNKRGDEYESALKEYDAEFHKLSAEDKADKFMSALRISANALKSVLNTNNYDIVQ